MDNFKRNVGKSFKAAKNDIIELQKAVHSMNQNQKWLIKKVIELTHGEAPVFELVASKESNKVHASNCPFAKNIKAETKQKFNSLDHASKYGYEACDCAVA